MTDTNGRPNFNLPEHLCGIRVFAAAEMSAGTAQPHFGVEVADACAKRPHVLRSRRRVLKRRIALVYLHPACAQQAAHLCVQGMLHRRGMQAFW